MRELIEIPFNDLRLHHEGLASEIQAAFNRVIKESSYILSEDVEEFETNFARINNYKHCISCGNGTDAIYVALKAIGIKPGDEVLVPANSWISTSEVVSQAGGVPVFVDVEPDFYTINPVKILEKISSKVVGIIPVHLYGHPASMKEITLIAEQYGLWIIEDSAQAHLAQIENFKRTSATRFSTYSFYPGKNLGALGDAGALLTDDDDLANHAKLFARHGGKGQHLVEGINSRMDGLQAAFLNLKLPKLPGWTQQRRNLSALYTELLSTVPEVITPNEKVGFKHVWHLYVIRVQKRDQLKAYLADRKISTVINYPTILPLLPAYKRLNHQRGEFPVAAKYQDEILSLPLFPEMEQEQVYRVVETIKDFFR